MVLSHQSISVSPWYLGMLLWYGPVSHIRHALSHLAAYMVITLPKVGSGAHNINVMVPSHQYVPLMP